MTFWDFCIHISGWLEERVTRILGLASGTLATLAATGVVPQSHLKYYMAAIAVLTFWRGQSTSATYQDAKAVLASVPTNLNQVKP